ncbi:Lrp/AsnC family transcriptional regulator [Pedobacter miscanthi]|uniref:AsnC family transcriptional regulator n=1 Tax=Pedobacter miscanthi TaxID=2259170 RepID=A0A366L366_9SPHI|nr:Lrp/AsnC family transcriptional regulator [Pedobacter miscanthi]RBQ07919.1 AsnC family transcriptional regulator [Pedobacter miscanthi]
MASRLLNPTDSKILNLLQKDGSLTYKEIAGKINKSMTNVVERIKLLKETGYIKKTVTLVDIHKIRSLFIAFPHVQLKEHSEENIRAFSSEMAKHPEVMECYHLTGHVDFMIKIALPDMASYNEFLREKIGSLEYVGSIQSFLVLSESKHETAYPL